MYDIAFIISLSAFIVIGMLAHIIAILKDNR